MIRRRDVGMLAVGLFLSSALFFPIWHNDSAEALRTNSVTMSPMTVARESAKREGDRRDSLSEEENDIRDSTSIRSLRRQPPTQNQMETENDAHAQKYASTAKQRDTQMLLAAGYSKERIEWLRGRAEELQAQRRQANTDLRMRGLPVDLAKEAAFDYGKDYELRNELGDDEYEKYLWALGRTSNVAVTDVFRGSLAESVGIRTGDKIIGYDNKRIFNFGEILGATMKNEKDNRSFVVNVQRDGHALQFVVPGGSLGIRSSSPSIDVSSTLSQSTKTPSRDTK